MVLAKLQQSERQSTAATPAAVATAAATSPALVPPCLVNFRVEFGTNALACHDQLGIVQFGSQRLSNVIANLHIGIPAKTEGTIGCNVFQCVIHRFESVFNFFTATLNIASF